MIFQGPLFIQEGAFEHQRTWALFEKQKAVKRKMSAFKQGLELPKAVIERNEEYRQRRRKQMIFFFATTAVTLVSSRLAYRGVQTRRCKLNQRHQVLQTLLTTHRCSWVIQC